MLYEVELKVQKMIGIGLKSFALLQRVSINDETSGTTLFSVNGICMFLCVSYKFHTVSGLAVECLVLIYYIHYFSQLLHWNTM